MEFKNQIVITGKAYNSKVHQTKNGKSITTFGLSIYNGKDANGKGTYCFIDCKIFEDKGDLSGDVLIDGKIAFDCYEKDGKKISKPIIIVNEVKIEQPTSQSTSPVAEQVPFDDTIPF